MYFFSIIRLFSILKLLSYVAFIFASTFMLLLLTFFKQDGSTPLLLCAENVSAAPIAELLLKKRLHLDKERDDGCTALHICGIVNNIIVTRLLLEYGAHVNCVNSVGFSVIFAPLLQLCFYHIASKTMMYICVKRIVVRQIT